MLVLEPAVSCPTRWWWISLTRGSGGEVCLSLVLTELGQEAYAGVTTTEGVVCEQALPDYEHAVIPEEKLRGYSLNMEHGTGQHKAKVFASTLGIEQQHWTYLHDQIIEGLPESEAFLHHETVREQVQWRHWTVPILVAGRNARRAFVTTGWVTTKDDREPRLTTAYIKPSDRHPRGPCCLGS